MAVKPRRCLSIAKGRRGAWGPGHAELPAEYRKVGQPVLIGGTMGTASYILVGTEQSERLAFGSACHGAGRNMSPTRCDKKMARQGGGRTFGG